MPVHRSAVKSVLSCVALTLGLTLVALLAACLQSNFTDSPDGRYRATVIRDGASAHYRVTQKATGRLVLTTTAQYATPNDVKAGEFSSDSRWFAAAYHYGHAGNYTWIGVWSIETREFYSKTLPGWTTSLSGVFDQPTAMPTGEVLLPDALSLQAPIEEREFVTRQDSQLMLADHLFRFVGTNAYFLQPEMAYGNTSGVTETLDTMVSLGMTVARIWAFNDNDPQQDPAAIQVEPGVYREEGLVALDRVVAEAKQRNIRLILTLVNYWRAYGGVNRYVSWCDCGASESDFYTSEQMKEWYKDYVTVLVDRTNTVTGISYKDEPTILAWELGNELRNPGGSVGALLAWHEEMAAYIKNLDPNHLVADGGEGFDDTPELYPGLSNLYPVRGDDGTSYHRLINQPSIDMVSYHLYPSSWGLDDSRDVEIWIRLHQQLAQQAGKVAYLGEFCATQADPLRGELFARWLRTALTDNLGAGALVWGLVYRSRPDYDTCSVYCPGDVDTCTVLGEYAARVVAESRP